MRLNVHLSFSGRCEEAFRHYAASLGGQIVAMLRYGESPIPAPAGYDGKIIHATLRIGDQTITGADVAPDDYQAPRGFSVLLGLESASEAERIFATLAESGSVQLPLGETFWALRFGMLTDRFGVPWMINCGSQT